MLSTNSFYESVITFNFLIKYNLNLGNVMKKNETLKIYNYGRRDQPKVALTFDDGPNPPVTDKILEILETKNAKATFFVIGKWIDRWTESMVGGLTD